MNSSGDAQRCSFLCRCLITAVGAELELCGMSRHALLNCAEKQFAVRAGSGDPPAPSNSSRKPFILSSDGLAAASRCTR
jgi:hypothetical protein